MSQNKPSDALTKPRRPLLVGGVIVGVVVALSGIGAGAYAIGQAVTSVEAPVASEPTPTEEPNAEPTASFSVLSVDDLTVSVDGANSLDPEGQISDYTWDFGDGGTASGATATHAYGAYGTYTVTLTVSDAEGASGAFSTEVNLIAPPPPPPPPPPAAPSCPAGSSVAEMQNGVVTYCMWDICRNLTLPDPSHPECDSAFRP